MKKHFSKALALLLALVMVLSMLPTMSIAAEKPDGEGFLDRMPEDDSYGVIYACGRGYEAVLSQNLLSDEFATAAVAEPAADGVGLKQLPEEAVVFRFLKTGLSDGSYYLMVQGKYLAMQDKDGSLTLVDSISDAGTKWLAEADKAGMAGAVNLRNARLLGGKDAYLRIAEGGFTCDAYSAMESGSFQLRIVAAAEADSAVRAAGDPGYMPVAGDKVVIYNKVGKAVFGQPTGPDQPKPNLLPAAAKLRNDSLSYNDIGDGGLIFKVSISDGYYTFQTGSKYLACSENYVGSDGRTTNDECLILVDAESEYTKWTLEAISGGYKIANKTAKWGSSSVVAEFFGSVFCGYSYYSDQPDKYAMRFYRISDRYNVGYVVNPSVIFDSGLFAAIGRDAEIKFTANDVSDVTATTAEYWFDGNSSGAKTAEVTYNNKIGTYIVPSADLAGHTVLNLKVTCTDTWNKTYSATTSVEIVDTPQILAVTPAPYSGTGEELRPEISVRYANAGANPTVTLRLDGEAVNGTITDERISYMPAQDLAQGKHSVVFSVTRADGKTASKNWSFFIGEVGEMLYFGQIHAHTAEYSDGAGTLEEAYEHAHGVDNLDYIIITDHSNYFDSTATATTSSYYDLASLSQNKEGTTTKWEEARATAKEYNDQWDDFICMYGYEMTWSGGPGHTNTFNTYGVVSRNNSELNNKALYAGMHRYNDLMSNADRGLDIEGKEAKTTRDGTEVTGVYATKYIPFDANGAAVPVVSQFNHPGKTFGNFDNFAGYTAKRDDVLNLVEVGNGEGLVGGSSYFPSYEQYDLCLSMGWHVGPTNNQDNHKGNWGSSNTCRDVVLTDDFSEIGIYRALDQRRIYSTEDQNLEIYYEMEIAGAVYKLGDIAPLDEDNQPDTVKAILTVEDPDATDTIGRIQVIGEGPTVLYEVPVSGSAWSGEIELSNTSGYYYIKIVQGDGDIAVTAPVWTRTAVPVAADLSTSAAVAAQGEQETVTATLTNGSENDALTLLSYKITAEGGLLEEKKDLSETLTPGQEKKIELPFTPADTNPPSKKTYEITAEFTYTFKGKTATIIKTMQETSYPASLMTYIGLDRGHSNFYVSGDYANNDASFIEICAERGIICQYIDAGKMTKENLKKYKAIVLTVPRINESTKPPVWTAAELEAIADYAANGGNIINLSKSDRYDYSEKGSGSTFDTYNYASATLSNMINEAVGAKTRFVRGIVVDTERKSNEAYRINFNGKDLLGDHPFTQGVFTSTNGQYQFYNGTGITIEAGAKNVTTLVAPYETSWITCYKGYPGHPADYFTGSAFMPDYDLKATVMAEKGTFSLVTAETLSGGGFLVCAGACFISNYDLKAGTPSNEQYENYALVCNILDYVKDGAYTGEITPIKDVHKGQVGQEFTVEGWVTSNASDYDKDTAFFDCIYVQDNTRGINCFPVSGYYYIGEKVRVHGGVTYYCGEIELNLSPDYNGSIEVISNELNELAPKKVTCKQAMSDDNIGNLMKIKGTIVDIHRTAGVVDYIYVDDGSGEIGTLFINAYIQKEDTELDKAEIGMMCEGIGIGSRDVDESSGGADGQGTDDPSLFIKRLRVRARDEIYCYYDPCVQFTDVNRDSWYHAGVDYVLEQGYMSGASETRFSPSKTLTRAQIVTILHSMAGKPAPQSTSNRFTDVKAGSWYEKAVLWAVENNISSGSTETLFNPSGTVTRQQLAVFLYKFAQLQGFDVSAKADLSVFPDLKDMSSWATSAMQWAVASGLISGTASNGVTYLKPKGNTTRAQVAVILMRFDQMDADNKNDIVILYTNDVHCAIDNANDSFGYAGLAAFKKDMETKHDYVGLVDAGDFIQGGPIGSLTKGAKIIPIMSKAGYEVVTLGNHEFDYGVDNILELTKTADFDFVTCNWNYIGPAGAADAVDLPAYVIKDYGEVKVAYVGITTPESLVKSTPTYFQDENGNWIYDFCNDEDGFALYQAVQNAVDAARAEGADYVIALSHLGTDASSSPWRSTDVILNTYGIDVVLDGHSHSVIPCERVFNMDGEEVLLTSTGTKLANVGKLTIGRDGSLKTELVSRDSFSNVDPDTKSLIDEINGEFAELLNQVVVEGLPVALTDSNPDRLDDTGKPVRAVRYQETNLGDVCADAYVYASGADIGFVNGGGIRKSIPAGNVTFGQIIDVHPFGNELCVMEVTGQQILDALEMSSRSTTLNAQGLPENECGGFLQVSGLKYTIYTGTASTVTTDSAGMYAGVTGARRVGSVQVLNKATGKYEPINPEKTYTLASHNYMLKQGGDGLNMFAGCKIIRDGGMLDNEVLINYFNSDLFRQRLDEGMYNAWDGGSARITLSSKAAPAAGLQDAFVLTSNLKEGDQVVIYNPGNKLAIKNESDGDWYLLGTQVTPENGLLTNPAADLVWTVHVDESGSYTFTQGESNAINCWVSGSYFELTNKADYPNGSKTWGLELANADSKFFYIYNSALTGSYGKVWLEFFPKNDVIKLSGYSASYDKLNEASFGFQFYVKAEPTYNLSTELKDYDKVAIYNPTNKRAISTEATGTKLSGVSVTVNEDVLTPDQNGKTAIYTVVYPEGDNTNFYLMLNDGTYLTTTASGGTLTHEAEPNDYSLWYLDVRDAEVGKINLLSTNASGKALQYSSGFTTGTLKNNNFFLFQLYVLGLHTTGNDVIKVGLQSVIAEAEAMDLTPYTEESVAALQQALTAAKAVLANDSATQAEVDAAAAALRSAIAGLKLLPVEGTFTLASQLQDGDEVVIYNPGNQLAIRNETDNDWYLLGTQVTPEENHILNPEENLVWTVHVDEDGAYYFTQGTENAITCWVSVVGDKTYYELTNKIGYANAVKEWRLQSANEDSSLFYIYHKTFTGNYGKVWLEFYDKNGTIKLSGYCTSDDRVNEDAFGFQFYVKD